MFEKYLKNIIMYFKIHLKVEYVMNKMMPIGIEDYTDINDYYYVDKTLLIKK